MGDGCRAALSEGADRDCTDNGLLSLREIQSSADEEGKHSVLLHLNGHKEKRDEVSLKPVNLWQYNGGEISGASSKLIHTTKEEKKVPTEKLKEELAKLSVDFDRQMQNRRKAAAERNLEQVE